MNKKIVIKAPLRNTLTTVKGRDAFDFLQRLTSQDLKRARPHEGSLQGGALLTASGTVTAAFRVLGLEDGWGLSSLSYPHLNLLADALERVHFAEDLTITQGDGSCVGYLGADFSDFQALVRQITEGRVARVLGTGFDADSGYGEIWVGANTSVENIRSLAEASGAQLLDGSARSEELWRLLTWRDGRLWMAEDFSAQTLVVEAPLEHFYSREKGCYPGQEVVERVSTQGILSKKLVGLVALPCSDLDSTAIKDARVLDAGSRAIVGRVKSVWNFAQLPAALAEMPWIPPSFKEKLVLHAMVQKPYYQGGMSLEVEGLGSVSVVEIG